MDARTGVARRRLARAVLGLAAALGLAGLALMAEIAWLRPDRVHAGGYALRLGAAALVGAAVGWLGSPRRLFSAAGWLLAGAMLLLILTLTPAAGARHGGARRMVSLSGVRWLPGPTAAVVAVLAVAWASRADASRWRRAYVTAGIGCLVVVHLLQPHFSNLAVLLGGVGVALFIGPRSRRVLLVLAGVIVVVGLAASQFGYVQRRVRLWTHPEENRDTAALRSIREQATWFGSLRSEAPAWRRLSSPHADYVLAFVLERHGLIGVLTLEALAGALVVTMWLCGGRSRDPSTRALSAGLAATVFVSAAVHTLVCLSLMPVTGMNFPLVGSGGSLLAATALAVGAAAGAAVHGDDSREGALLESISERRARPTETS